MGNYDNTAEDEESFFIKDVCGLCINVKWFANVICSVPISN